jgi:hypothetical protein
MAPNGIGIKSIASIAAFFSTQNFFTPNSTSSEYNFSNLAHNLS